MYSESKIRSLFMQAIALCAVVGVATSCSRKELAVDDAIRFNQLGFYPAGEKVAVIYSDTVGKQPFSIRDMASGRVVYTGVSSELRSSSFSDRNTSVIRFDDVTVPGQYRIEIPAVGQSRTFTIGDDRLRDVALAGLKAFYYQRASTPVEEKYAGEWSRPSGHPDDSVLIHSSAATASRPEGTVISSPKGWYDAGDYNKYIVNSGFTVGVLLSLYEDFPDEVQRQNANIPESGNSTPDLLDEVFWNIDWMLTMQDPYDGGVYHKLTEPDFEGFIKPTDCRKQRYAVAKSVTATLDFAASMAQASRIYAAYEADYPGVAEKTLSAARRAYEWALKNPNVLYRQRDMNEKYDPDITTGEYGDRSAEDEFFWAAVELYITTREAGFLSTALAGAPSVYRLPTWSRVGGLGAWTLIRYAGTLEDETSKKLSGEMQAQLLAYADSAVQNAESAPYCAPYGRDARDFFWGCNSDAASNQGVTFLYAWLLTNDNRYRTAALHDMDYILGRNATGYCYITGQGYKSPMNPHHRLSASDESVDPIPGFLAGGPNPGKQDKCEYPSDIPDECYVDVTPAYAANEIAINWQSLFTYFATALNASMQRQ
ncbi:MAG: glycoside hydrolase family 9 protein [Tannerellaceae bacterium]|jgi:endoglucanase|nr:glycoside hydrolase family 9 protein [Tannerellaceae bacterium]